MPYIWTPDRRDLENAYRALATVPCSFLANPDPLERLWLTNHQEALMKAKIFLRIPEKEEEEVKELLADMED